MIPNIAKKGHNFKGAALYYLHDKALDSDAPNELKPKTDERVAFIATRNLAFDDPDKAVSEMIATAWAQNDLKREAGLSTAGLGMNAVQYDVNVRMVGVVVPDVNSLMLIPTHALQIAIGGLDYVIVGGLLIGMPAQ